MTDRPEIRAKILEWQKRYNIQDGDPALALIELIDIIQPGGGAAPAPGEVTAAVSAESLAEAMKTAVLPVTERLAFQTQELQQKLDQLDMDRLVKQVEAYHEGIDYCTKKLDVIKKEADALVVKAEKAGLKISPISRGAVVTLMIFAAIIGAIIANYLK